MKTMESSTIQYKLAFHSDWHCGSGLSAGADVDALVVKDADGLPFVPGKTIKGLVREAMTYCGVDDEAIKAAFGVPSPDKGEGARSGQLFFGNATLSDAKAVKENGAQRFLYRQIANTAIGENGVAKDHSLRKTEVVVPCELTGRILGVSEEMRLPLEKALKLIKNMGLGRNRGLGRCSFCDIEEVAQEKSEPQTAQAGGTLLKYQCVLKSDVIINQKAQTEGPNKTLDFIPGACFMGIVAGALYARGNGSATEIIHSGKVKFGDAHPAHGNVRTLRGPAAMFSPKLMGDADNEKNDGGRFPNNKYYIHHRIASADMMSGEMRRLQLKQLRTGFYDFSDKESVCKVGISTRFAIKSAYDSDTRRSKDEQMFGYESLPQGLRMYFSVECETEEEARLVDTCLRGVHRVGRSRSAQYGLVEITPFDFVTCDKRSDGEAVELVIYAESRLIFLDKWGQCTYQPEAADFGLESGEIAWEKSQIRTFQYSPWNYKRQCFDTDRCGIEKGSVIVIRNAKGSVGSHVGYYQSEGFGRVIVNPAFLSADELGVAEYQPAKSAPIEEKQCVATVRLGGNALLEYLAAQKKKEEAEQEIYKKVNEWVEDNVKYFKGENFASQWGTIRSLAMQCPDWETLNEKLFSSEDGYLCHGVAKEKWQERGRKEKFQRVCEENKSNAQLFVVNLAAEMAKRIRKEEKK